jgi:hypothetical protein
MSAESAVLMDAGTKDEFAASAARSSLPAASRARAGAKLDSHALTVAVSHQPVPASLGWSASTRAALTPSHALSSHEYAAHGAHDVPGPANPALHVHVTTSMLLPSRQAPEVVAWASHFLHGAHTSPSP